MAKQKKDPLAKLPKRHRENMRNRPENAVDASQAFQILKGYKAPKFDQTVEVVFWLGIDPKQADQALRGSVAMPKGIGKSKRVVAFCQGDVVKEALAAGAVKAGGEDVVGEIEKGWMDFDVAVASPDMMRVISKLGRVLGPKGLMPSPKAGTVTSDVPKAVQEYSAGKVEYRTDKTGNIHAPIGKMSFSAGDLLTNYEHFLRTIESIRPSSVRGQYIKKISVSGTMTPSVLIVPPVAAVAS